MRYKNAVSARRALGTAGLAALAIGMLSPAGLAREPQGGKIERAITWEADGVSVTSDFEGGRLNKFYSSEPGEYTAVIAPEWRPMNNQQAWYAFRIRSERPRSVSITLTYTDEKQHLFYPKLSHDGVAWQPIAKDKLTVSKDEKTATLKVNIGPEPLWISAQELFTSSTFDKWMAGLQAGRPFITVTEVGKSTEGRPIKQMVISEAPASAPCVIVLGRQHPPEVTGTLGLKAFAETIASDDELARKYRKNFRTVFIPLVNPDGVDNGHWRYNVNGVDINRDWDRFEQKETQVARDAILAAEKQAGGKVAFYIDYHSTWKDVFYANPVVVSSKKDDELEAKDRIVRHWIAKEQSLVPQHQIPVEVSEATQNKKANSVTWMRSRGYPSVTHEFAHTTDRGVIREVGTADALALMGLLLEKPSAMEAGE